MKRSQFITTLESRTVIVKYDGLDESWDHYEHTTEDKEYRVTEHKSIFTRRYIHDLRDITISKVNPAGWGALHDGRYYTSIATIAVEDGRVIRGHIEAVPDHILGNLKEWGFSWTSN